MTKHCLRGFTALILALTLTTALLPAASALPFRDVPQDYWASREILDMAAQGLLQGNGGVFHPESCISKQALLSVACRAAGLDDRRLQSGAAWADPAAAFALYFGWVTEEELQDRTVPATREFAAQLLIHALFPKQAEASEVHFTDEQEIAEHRRPYVAKAAELGIIQGYPDGSFHPQGIVTRAAAAVMLSRALALLDQGSTGETVQVPVLMYHDVSYLGSGYSMAPEVFRRQMQELKDAGFHTVFLSQVADFVEKGTILPSKPIVITLDDGYATNYQYVYPILQELEMKAEISVIGDAIEWAEWGMRWDQLREMCDSGLVSVQSHTQNLHVDLSRTGGRCCTLRLPGESWQDYVRVLGDDTRAIRDSITENLGTEPLVYTYPLGKWNAMGEAVSAQLGFRVSLTTKDGVSVVRQGDPSSLRLMNRIGMDFRTGNVLPILRKIGYKG